MAKFEKKIEIECKLTPKIEYLEIQDFAKDILGKIVSQNTKIIDLLTTPVLMLKENCKGVKDDEETKS